MKIILFVTGLLLLLLSLSLLNADIVEDIGIEMIFIEGGSFQMGNVWGVGNVNDDEFPVHEVTLSDYYLSATEVTNAQYCKFLNEEGESD